MGKAMIQQLSPETAPKIIYPDSDGQPMSDNTKQFRWIVTIKENLELLLAIISQVFIAGDLLWYPIVRNRTPTGGGNSSTVGKLAASAPRTGN